MVSAFPTGKFFYVPFQQFRATDTAHHPHLLGEEGAGRVDEVHRGQEVSGTYGHGAHTLDHCNGEERAALDRAVVAAHKAVDAVDPPYPCSGTSQAW